VLNVQLHSYIHPRLCALFLLDMMEWLTGTWIWRSLWCWQSGIIVALYATGWITKPTFMEAVQEFNRVQLIIAENHMETTVYVQWGKIIDDSVVYGDLIPVPPKTAIGRKIRNRHSRFSSERHTVRVCKSMDVEEENVVSPLWEPDNYYLIKVFIIKDTEVTEHRNPEVRNWMKGALDVYEDE
jgi:hypothetical protein